MKLIVVLKMKMTPQLRSLFTALLVGQTISLSCSKPPIQLGREDRRDSDSEVEFQNTFDNNPFNDEPADLAFLESSFSDESFYTRVDGSCEAFASLYSRCAIPIGNSVGGSLGDPKLDAPAEFGKSNDRAPSESLEESSGLDSWNNLDELLDVCEKSVLVAYDVGGFGCFDSYVDYLVCVAELDCKILRVGDDAVAHYCQSDLESIFDDCEHID